MNKKNKAVSISEAAFLIQITTSPDHHFTRSPLHESFTNIFCNHSHDQDMSAE